MKNVPNILTLIAVALPMAVPAAVSIDTVYFAQTHVLKPDDPYFGLVSNRDALIKAHIVDPDTPASPPVTASLSLGGQTHELTLDGPATLPASIPDGPGVVQHSLADSFIAIIPAAWVQPGLQVAVTAGPASVDLTNLEIGAPTRVIMRMFDVHYFSHSPGDYTAGTLEEIEAKWPVAGLEVRRLRDIVFPELVIPPRAGLPAARVSSRADYRTQTGQNFDGEQAAALAWNGALKRAGGRNGRIYLSYINIYGVPAGGQAGGFSGVGNGTGRGILHHELGHALSLPHWGNHAAYPYKGAMHQIPPPDNYNETHAGPTWGFDLRTQTFIPCTVQPNNVGNHPSGTYKVDPMQGGGTGYQEPAFLLNHFSDYSMNQMRNYLEGHVLIWNESLEAYASWNQQVADYTNPVTNNGVQYPVELDAEVITVMASVSGAKPDVNMVYPPIGPYTGGLIKRFDPTRADDREEARAIFAPANGCDVSLRILQGGVEKIYMLAASWEPAADPLSRSSLKTEAVNLPAADGDVTRAELLYTPDAEDNGLPSNPQILYTWSPVTPDPASFAVAPTPAGSSAVTMTATEGTSQEGSVEYLFTETTGNPGGSSSGWQSSPSYIDTGLQPSTTYAYTVTMRDGSYTGRPSAEASATTGAAVTPGTIDIDHHQSFPNAPSGEQTLYTVAPSYDASGSDKLVVSVSTEDGWNRAGQDLSATYNGVSMTRAVQGTSSNGTAAVAIFYLDDPGPAGPIVVTSSRPNSGMTTVYALSGTADGVAATAGAQAPSTPITTLAENSMVIAHHGNGFDLGNNGAAATADPPLMPTGSYRHASGWTGAGSGYQQVATPGIVSPTFSNVGAGNHVTVAAEFLAAPLPDYEAWAAGYPGADLSDPDADLDGDGLSNNHERVWALDPTSALSVSPFIAPFSPSGSFSYTRRHTSLTGLSYSYQWSPTLASGSWTAFTPAGEATDSASPVETVTVTLNAVLMSFPQWFVRVVAE